MMASRKGFKDIPQFDGESSHFQAWADEFEAYMCLKGEWEYFSPGKEPELKEGAEDDEEVLQSKEDQREWNARSRRAYCCLFLALTEADKEIVREFKHQNEAARRAWEALVARKHQSGCAAGTQVCQQIFSLRMRHGEKAEDYLTRANKLWTTATIIKAGVAEKQFLSAFVMGLDNSWAVIRTLLQEVEERWTLEYIRTRILDEVSRREIQEKTDKGSALFSSQGKATGRNSGKGKPPVIPVAGTPEEKVAAALQVASYWEAKANQKKQQGTGSGAGKVKGNFQRTGGGQRGRGSFNRGTGGRQQGQKRGNP